MIQVSQVVKSISESERSTQKNIFLSEAIRMDKGDPNFKTAIHIQEAAAKAMRDNLTHYGNPSGINELREAICLSLERDFGVERNPENILITAGGIEALNVIVATYINPGDEVIIFNPDYSAYVDSVKLFAGVPVLISKTESFKIDFEKLRTAISKKCRMIILSNPCNPTGKVLNEKDVRALGEIASQYNLLLVVDEVYYKLLYDDFNHFSVCKLEDVKNRTILLNSFSKTYAMTGWRVGYLVSDERIIQNILLPHKALLTCVNIPAQKACVAAIIGSQKYVKFMKGEYNKRRQIMETVLKKIVSLKSTTCEGGFYFFPSFKYKTTSKKITQYLYENKILVRSGTEFGKSGEGNIRLSFAAIPTELLEEKMFHFKKVVDGYRVKYHSKDSL